MARALLGAKLIVLLQQINLIWLKRSTGNAFVYPLILGTSVGRIGCFLTRLSVKPTELLAPYLETWILVIEFIGILLKFMR